MATRAQSALAGVAGIGVTLATSELVAAVMDGVPSLVNAVGSLLVPVTPPALKDFAVSTFGTSDKAVLAGGTVVIALLIGAWIGDRDRRDTATTIGVFALIGFVAQLQLPLTVFPMALLTTAFVAWLGWWTLHAVRDRADADADAAETADEDVVLPRRQFVLGVAGAGAVAVVAASLSKQLVPSIDEVAADLGAFPTPTASMADVPAGASLDIPGITPVVTSNDDFYLIDTALSVPRIDVDDWTLRIHGMVDREVVLTFDDLRSMDVIERHITMLCVSNEVGGDLVGNAKWLGVPLRDVLDMAGVQDGAGQIVGRSIDGWTGGFPTEVAYDGRDAIIAIAMNDEPLPPAHGFPARLVVPGLYGYVSATKWVTEIELTTWEGFDGFWVPRGWSKEGPVKTQSRIDVPRPGARLADDEELVVAGVAWAPTRGIERVEVRIDEGEWIEADLAEAISDDTWVQWSVRPQGIAAGNHVVECRATDRTGEVQSETPVPPRPDGAEGYDRSAFTT